MEIWYELGIILLWQSMAFTYHLNLAGSYPEQLQKNAHRSYNILNVLQKRWDLTSKKMEYIHKNSWFMKNHKYGI